MTVAIQPHRKTGDAAIERRHDLCRPAGRDCPKL